MIPSPPPAPAPKAPRLTCGPLTLKQNTLLPRASVAAGGPVPKLVRAGRLALMLWLLLVAAASKDAAIVEVRFFRTFGERCLGLSGLRGTVTSQVSRAIAALEELRLIEVVQRRHGSTVIRLRSLDGHGQPYAMPRREDRVLYVPGLLFANGWHVTLSATALAALLIAWTEESYQFNKVGEHQWEKSRAEISRDYDIAESTWSEAKKELQGWGLLLYDQRAPVRRRSFYPVDRYTVHTEVLDRRPEDAARIVAERRVEVRSSPVTGQPRRVYRYRYRAETAEEPGKVLRLPGAGREDEGPTGRGRRRPPERPG